MIGRKYSRRLGRPDFAVFDASDNLDTAAHRYAKSMHTLPIILMLLGASVVSVILFRRMNLPPMLGYLVVGALIGPHAFNLLEGFTGATVEELALTIAGKTCFFKLI